MAERITGPFAIGGGPASSLAFLAATGIVGTVLVGGLFAACFSLLAPPPLRMRPAAPISIAAGSFSGPAEAVAATEASGIEHTALTSPPPQPDPAVATLPPATMLSAGDIARAIARGDAFSHNGDLAVARFFFQLAADAGDRRAALRLGETFDPAFLTHRRGRGNPQAARYWYQRALDLGASDAPSRLAKLEAETNP
jgi:hypothetical protein